MGLLLLRSIPFSRFARSVGMSGILSKPDLHVKWFLAFGRKYIYKKDLTTTKDVWSNRGMRAAEKLVQHYGGKQAVALALDVHEETIRLWLRDGIPLASAIKVEERSGGVVTAEQILREAKAAA